MADRAPFTDEELDIISEMLLDKMLKRLAKSVQPVAPEESTQKRDSEPTLDDYAVLRARRRKQGRR